jgi:hypothetical protein
MKSTPHDRQPWFAIVLGAWIGCLCGALLLLAVRGRSPSAMLEDLRVAARPNYDDSRADARTFLVVDALASLIGGIGGSVLGGWAAARLTRRARMSSSADTRPQ